MKLMINMWKKIKVLQIKISPPYLLNYFVFDTVELIIFCLKISSIHSLPNHSISINTLGVQTMFIQKNDFFFQDFSVEMPPLANQVSIYG